MSSSDKRTVGRVRTKTYSITLYLVLLAVVIQFAVIAWNFSIRSQVKIDIDAPEIPPEESIATIPVESKKLEVTPLKPVKPAPLGSNSSSSTNISATKEKVQSLLTESQRFLDQQETALSRNALLEAESLEPDNVEVIKKIIELAVKIDNKSLATEYQKRLTQLTGITSTTHPIPPEKASPPEKLTPEPVAPEKLDSTLIASKDPTPAHSTPIPSVPPVVNPPPNQPEPIAKKILIGALEKKVIPSSNAKTEFLLKIPIVAAPSTEPLEPGKISIKLYFYELQMDGKVVPSNARLDVSFENKRPNWSSRTEILNALYSLPNTQTNRTYYGYRLKIYYRGQFQGEISEPENLSDKLP